MKDTFYELAGRLERELRSGETLLCTFSGERSDFVRFNQGKVRQAGSVEQQAATIRLVSGRRHAAMDVAMPGDVDTVLGQLREVVRDLPEDPWLLINEQPQSSESVRRGRLPRAEEVVGEVSEGARGLDFVGIYAGGVICRGFSSSLGQRNWHEVDSFNLDWSLHLRADQAVKASYAGFEWERERFHGKLADAAGSLEALKRERKTIPPGEYRAWLAPRAMEDILGTIAWGGFSARSLQTRQSPLLRMQNGEGLSPRISLAENTGEGVAPGFQSDGFAKPARVSLIERGALKGALVSPRSAREYGLEGNAANGGELPEALDLAGGDLAESDVLAALDTGLYVGNLWYLNFSDRPAGRLTGMTRFATFWVEGGRIVAPLAPMRFDDTLHRMLGEKLEALGRERELLLDTYTYGQRSTSSARLPGALLSGLRFTL